MFAARLRMKEDEDSRELLGDEARWPGEWRRANPGRDLQLPASARTTNWRDSHAPGLGLRV